MSGDYINREAARPDAFCEGVSCQECPFCKDPVQGGCRIDDFVKSIPAADVVERKVGHWIFHPEQKNIYGGKLIECSECKAQYLVMNVMEEIYCRHCGSKNQNGGQDDV